MSDFAYAYFSTELDKLSLPDLERLFEKIKGLIAKQKEKSVSKEKVLPAFLTEMFAIADKEPEKHKSEGKWTRDELYRY